MNIFLTNDKLEIIDPSDEILDFAKSQLSYTDKSKQYQLKRMGKNPWLRVSPEYAALQASIHGQVFEIKNNSLRMSSGLLELFRNTFPSLKIIDERKETGIKIALPWINKPFDTRPYQDEAINMMLNPTTYRGIINFAMGLGKTLTAIHLIQKYKRNTLIICPSDSI